MTSHPRRPLPRKGIWGAFWLIWALIFIGFNGWDRYTRSTAYPFTRTYNLGLEEVDEKHQLSSLAWSRYGVFLRFVGRTEANNPESQGTVRDAIGGDIAVELTSETGQVIIPRKFVFESKPAGGQPIGFESLTYPLDGGYYAFEPKTSDRFKLRVVTVKTPAAGTPREVELSIRGMDAGYASLGAFIGNVFFGLVLIVSGVALLIILRIIDRRANRVSRAVQRPGRPSSPPPTSGEVSAPSEAG